MEMNTRLQVEHPVTEAITGVDLVEWQLRVASGEGLPKRQDELSITGHAFESRLYAEDVPKGFLPATGTLAHLAFPEGARADSGVRTSDTISPFYDPMIAKIITHGPSRAVALKRMARALAETQVAGTVTNLSFLGALCAHEGFAAGDVDTGLIGRDLDSLVQAPLPSDEERGLAALVALGLTGAGWPTGFHLWSAMKRQVRLSFKDEAFDVVVESLNEAAHDVSFGDTRVEARCVGGRWRLNGQLAPDAMLKDGKAYVFAQYGLSFDVIDPLERAASVGAGAALIEAPMPGLVKAVFTRAGEPVKAGDRLAILEAMKMEHSLLAARDGIVAEVLCEAGAQVEAGAALIRLEEEDAEAAA
jgi:3-methylcrotonyl-CoA carboxylase alpha subunit